MCIDDSDSLMPEHMSNLSELDYVNMQKAPEKIKLFAE